MCGRFAQFHSRDEFLAALDLDTPVSTTGDWHARYNVAPGTPVPLFHHHDDQLQLAPVDWGYAPAWWHAQGKPALINARVETAASSRMFAPLWKHGRALVPASGWYEWKKSPGNPRLKQPYFIYPADRSPLFFAALCATDLEEAGSFVIITAASHDGLADIHDRRPLALPAAAARDWLDSRMTPPPGDMLADVYSLQAESFSWQPVSSDVGTVRNDSASLIVTIDTPKV
ncbi:SOS response-associated peptidase family protein (plasmid) [Serratia sp. PAMC26656]|uniref:SOS response-associated peptidase family protein n=1 Tax=Serratia sp. PAMC26656 TaxID=2775909 RepID=UPI0018F656C4|nr:SOS response-associated peptidase family protein [Serratia sp. PAMC26656]MBJ7889480.1 SOS response-associated peptidase family protein [Serratia sp. PAMC26656]